MPPHHLGVRLRREGLGGERGRERRAGVRVLEGPVLHRVLEERDVRGRAEEDLDGRPADEAAGGEGGDRGGEEVVCAGLEGVLAADVAPDVGDAVVGYLEEETCFGVLA